MSLLHTIRKLFTSSPVSKIDEPNITFGRYSDAYKTEAQYDHLNKSVLFFENHQYLKAYAAFFDYLLDTKENNVSYTLGNHKIDFEIIQGSKKIVGYATTDQLIATVNVVKYDLLSVPCMRKLLETNYYFKYCRFATDENAQIVCLKFSTSVLDGSPYKLYFALKEMAIEADKQDDLLLKRFPKVLQEIDSAPIYLCSKKEKQVKYHYLKKWINDTLYRIKKLDSNTYGKEISFILLNLCYKIDYLIAPQAQLKHQLESISDLYFSNENMPVTKLNALLIQAFEKIADISKKDIRLELYGVKATFGIVDHTNPDKVLLIIGDLLEDFSTTPNTTSLPILEYALQYCFFHFGIPNAIKAVFHLIVRVINVDYFEDLGYHTLYYKPDKQKFDKSAIKQALKQIEAEAQQEYPNFKLNHKKISYKSVFNFSHSLLVHLQQTNYD